jgi:DNA-directed RNA polymerase specialized sigma24 family protein
MGKQRKETRREEIRREIFGLEGTTEPMDEVVSFQDLGLLLSDLLAELGEKCRQVLTLWAEGLSYEEIVKRIDTNNPGTARKRKHDCIERLTSMIEERPALRQQLLEYLTA